MSAPVSPEVKPSVGDCLRCEGPVTTMLDTLPGMPQVPASLCDACNDHVAEVILARACEPPSECPDCTAAENGVCSECCEHGDQDDYSCLDCGKEMLEDRMAAAYDRAKAARQDG